MFESAIVNIQEKRHDKLDEEELAAVEMLRKKLFQRKLGSMNQLTRLQIL